jgi:hypothetical protein
MRNKFDERPSNLVEPSSVALATPVASASDNPCKRWVMIVSFPLFILPECTRFKTAPKAR